MGVGARLLRVVRARVLLVLAGVPFGGGVAVVDHVCRFFRYASKNAKIVNSQALNKK